MVPTGAQRSGGGFWSAVDERIGISALKYEVPEHARGVAYSLGGITLAGFVVLFATGIWLAQFYDPMPEHVRSSMLFILREAPAGFFMRNLHYWAANAVMLTVLLHMLRVLFSGAYKRPREANWLIGVGLLAVTIGFVFTGSVLKWDQESIEGLAHNVEAAQLLGGLGAWFSPSFAASVPLLVRTYVAHVAILPTLLLVLLALHFLLIKLHGLAPNAFAGRDATTRRTAAEPSRSTFLAHLAIVGHYSLIGLGTLVVLAAALPAQLGPAPVEGLELTKPWWMFLSLFAVENWLGIGGIFWASMAVFAALALVPLLDRIPQLHPSRRWLFLAAYGVLALSLVALGIYAKLAAGAAHLGE